MTRTMIGWYSMPNVEKEMSDSFFWAAFFEWSVMSVIKMRHIDDVVWELLYSIQNEIFISITVFDEIFSEILINEYKIPDCWSKQT